jgi:DNA-binding response OmpR family regulator
LNGEELEKELDFGSVDLLIVDYHLDQGNGIDLAKRLLGETSIDIPVLVVTANHSQTLNETIRREGFSLLHKPLKPLLFRQRLRQLLG